MIACEGWVANFQTEEALTLGYEIGKTTWICFWGHSGGWPKRGPSLPIQILGTVCDCCIDGSRFDSHYGRGSVAYDAAYGGCEEAVASSSHERGWVIGSGVNVL